MLEKLIPKGVKKYIGLLDLFKYEIQKADKGSEYRQMLVNIVMDSTLAEFESVKWCTI